MAAARQAVKVLYGQDVPEKMVQLQKTRSEFEGNLTLVVFPFVKMARKSPEQTGREIGEYLVEQCGAISRFNVVKGFLNLSISDEAWLRLLADIDADPGQIGLPGSPTKVKTVVNVVFQAKESKVIDGADENGMEDLVKELIAEHIIG